jgi:hypothetical protein
MSNLHFSSSFTPGAFRYEGAQSKDDPQLTMWRFEIYGGVDFGGDPKVTANPRWQSRLWVARR